MKKLKLDLDELVVDSFATAAVEEARGTVDGLQSCNTCEDLDCSAVCTGGSCGGTGTGSGNTAYGGTCDTPCGPGGSDIAFGCGSGGAGCQTYYGWTGCDYSCVWGPCGSGDC